MGVLDLLIVLRWSPLLASNKHQRGEPWCHTVLRYFLLSLRTVYVLCEREPEHTTAHFYRDKLLWFILLSTHEDIITRQPFLKLHSNESKLNTGDAVKHSSSKKKL